MKVLKYISWFIVMLDLVAVLILLAYDMKPVFTITALVSIFATALLVTYLDKDS